MKLNTYNNMVDYHKDEESNTNNFINGLYHFYDKFNILYIALGEIEKKLGVQPVVIPSFNFLDPSPNSPTSKFEELKFKVRNKDKEEVKKVIEEILKDDNFNFEYITEEDTHVLRFK